MDMIDNINTLWGDALGQDLRKGSRVKISASTFSFYAFEALKSELEKVEILQLLFTSLFLAWRPKDRQIAPVHAPEVGLQRPSLAVLVNGGASE